MGKVFGIIKIMLGGLLLLACFWFEGQAFLSGANETLWYRLIRFVILSAYGGYFIYSGWTELNSRKVESLILWTGVAIGFFYVCSLSGLLLMTNEFFVLLFILFFGVIAIRDVTRIFKG